MVASIRNISARGVRIEEAVVPPPPNIGVTIRTTSGTMTYWSQYVSAYPGISGLTGTFDSAQKGSNITLSGLDYIASFSNSDEAVLGTQEYSTTPNYAWEFLIQVPYNIAVGSWDQGYAGPFDGNTFAGGPFAAYYQNNGNIVTYAGTVLGATYTYGDIIGIVTDGSNLAFFKNGVFQNANGVVDNSNSFAMATRP
jgi:hypothetical protein